MIDQLRERIDLEVELKESLAKDLNFKKVELREMENQEDIMKSLAEEAAEEKNKRSELEEEVKGLRLKMEELKDGFTNERNGWSHQERDFTEAITASKSSLATSAVHYDKQIKDLQGQLRASTDKNDALHQQIQVSLM
jgi:predicted nuclease with TOPRIM domain